ncbi:MAG: hypothetical protein U7123_07255 [Potamolinea sp.]
MSAFNPKSNKLSPVEWQAKASETIEKTGSQYLIIGGIVVGLFAASATAFPPTGILVAGWCFYEAYRKTQVANRNEEAIALYGCVAHVLQGDDFQSFRNQVGALEVEKQIQWANDNGYALSSDALDFLETQEKTPAPTTPQIIGTDSRLKAVEVSSSPVATAADMVIDTYNAPNGSFDLIGRMAADVCDHLIVGIPGAGKGVLVSNALEEIKKRSPNIKIFYLDPKGDEKETGYFTGRCDVLKRAKARTMAPADAAKWFKQCIKEFEALPGDKLLVFDEATNISGKFKSLGGSELRWFQDVLRGFISCGDSEGLRVWIVCQNPHTEALGFDGGLRSQFTPIAIVAAKNLAAYGALISTKFIPQNQKLDSDQIEALSQESPVGRCFYHGGVNQWFPLPELTNFSGFSRDSRQHIVANNQPSQLSKDSLSDDERQQLEKAIGKLSHTSHLSPESELILEIIKTAKVLPITFDAIRKSRRWDKKQPDKEALLDWLKELIRVGKIAGAENEGYALLD